MQMQKAEVIKDMPIAEYHAHPAISKSGLSTILSSSPAHYWERYRNPDHVQTTSSPEKIFGNAFHAYVLEPDVFEATYIEAPDLNKNTSAYKTFRKEAEGDGKIILDSSDITRIRDMGASLRRHEAAAAFLPENNEGVLVETSIFWTDPEFGVLCKCRPDIFLTQKMILPDVKTARSAAASSFSKDVFNYGYDMQEAHYSAGINTVYPGYTQDFPFLCIEKEAPYAVSVYRLSPAYKAIGYARYRKAMEVFASCEKNNVWPAYADGIQEIDPPYFAAKASGLDFSEVENETHYAA